MGTPGPGNFVGIYLLYPELVLGATIKLSSCYSLKDPRAARLPKGATAGARGKIKLDGLRFVNWTWVEDNYLSPPSTYYLYDDFSDVQTSGNLRALLVGEKPDGTWEPIGGGESFFVEDGVETWFDFTSALQRMLGYKNSPYREVFLGFFPAVVDIVGLNNGTATWQALLDTASIDEYGSIIYTGGTPLWVERHARSAGPYVAWDSMIMSDLTVEGIHLPTSGSGTMNRQMRGTYHLPKMN